MIETRGLTKRYGSSILAVNDLNLIVRRGEVYGFLGSNGAGKTTTMRMLLGLIRPTSGTIDVLGEGPGKSRTLRSVGSMVEAPAFYPYLSGRDNLRAVARYSGRASTGNVDEVLKRVGLYERAGYKFGKYSQGMKQRLGVAAALLNDPELLVLDEPTNGLDPEAMAEMRELICELGRRGRTVFLSSHMLGEVEQVCDRVGVVSRGRLVAEGTLSELVGAGRLLVKAEPLAEAAQIARRLSGVREVEVLDDTLRLAVGPEEARRVNKKLVSAGVEVDELRWSRRSLEDVFLELAGEGG